MNPPRFWLSLLPATAFTVALAAAQVETGREAALDYIGRGTAAFRNGDIIAATRLLCSAFASVACRSLPASRK